MKHFPLFSIVIPTYNRGALIEKTLQSIWQQTYSHYEVIVVDNCSTDNTTEVLTPYVRDQRIRFIRHDRNLERAQSRNTGMGVAQGDFLTLLDSDDLMYPTNLEDAANYVAAHPDSKCFHNLSQMVDADGKVIYRPRFPDLKDQVKAIAWGNFMGCTGDFVHREIYTQYRFATDPLIIGAEDWEFWLRVLARYKVGRIEKVNSAVVHHETRSVNSQNIARLEQGVQLVVKNIDADPYLSSVYANHLKSIAASSMTYLAMLANEGGSHKLALSYLYRAAKENVGVFRSRRFLRSLQIALFGLVRRISSPADNAAQNSERRQA